MTSQFKSSPQDTHDHIGVWKWHRWIEYKVLVYTFSQESCMLIPNINVASKVLFVQHCFMCLLPQWHRTYFWQYGLQMIRFRMLSCYVFNKARVPLVCVCVFARAWWLHVAAPMHKPSTSKYTSTCPFPIFHSTQYDWGTLGSYMSAWFVNRVSIGKSHRLNTWRCRLCSY